MKRKTILLFAGLFISIFIIKAQPSEEIQQLLTNNADVSNEFGRSVCVSGDYAIVGVPYDDGNGSTSGCAYIYYNNSGTWLQQAKILASDGTGYNHFGCSVSISGDYAIVGAYDESGNSSGAAYIYYNNSGIWEESVKLTPSDGVNDDWFGFSVSISGNHAIVGAPMNDVNADMSGAAYIYYNNSGTWNETKISASDGAEMDHFGVSVSIENNNAVVGAYGDDNFLGSAYIFINISGWFEYTKLTASDGVNDDYFGYPVNISGDYVIVGACGDDDNGNDSGSSYIFYNNLGTWIEQAKLLASDGTEDDYFGFSASISGDYAIVGAFDESGNSSGAAYIFYNNSGTWEEESKLTASDAYEGDQFGKSVSISSDYVIIGSPRDDDYAENSGSAYIYYNDAGTWDEYTKLIENSLGMDDRFGISVCVSGNYAIVGADSNDDMATNAGVAYIYYNDAGNWIQHTKLTASDASEGDRFGCSVSISGELAIVGADNADNSGTDQGAVYIFYNNEGIWEELTKVTGYSQDYDYFGSSVSISGEYFVAGAAMNDLNGENSGKAYIYNIYYNGSYWILSDGTLSISDAEAGANFGNSVNISGDYAIVGAYQDDYQSGKVDIVNAGCAYIFYNNSGTWEEQSKLVASDRAMDDFFGLSVSISGDYAIVGAVNNDDNGSNSGSAYVFYNNSGTWEEDTKLTASDGAADDAFGCSVSILGDDAVVGSCFDDDNNTNSGSVYTFHNNSGTWEQQTKLTAANNNEDGNFGFSVSLFDDCAIIGAIHNNSINVINSGSAYVFGPPPVSITSQPENQTDICIGSNISFTVTGDNIYTYKWQESTDGGSVFLDISENGTYSGVQTETLNISGVTDDMDNYQYRCIVSNSVGDVISNSAILTIDAINPTITCVDNQEVNADVTETYTVSGTEFDPVATDDNCGVESVINDFNNSATLAGAVLPAGTTTIVWTVTDAAENNADCSFEVLVNEYVDIEELKEINISIYPNPTNGEIIIDFSSSEGYERMRKIEITDITGKTVYTSTTLSACNNQLQINLSSFEKGIYIISIQTDKEIFTSKIVKE